MKNSKILIGIFALAPLALVVVSVSWLGIDWLKPMTSHWLYIEATKWQTGIGAFLGLTAVLIAASLTNFNDRQQKKLERINEAKNLATVLSSEIRATNKTLESFKNNLHADAKNSQLNSKVEEHETAIHFSQHEMLVPYNKMSRIYEKISDQIGALPSELTNAVVDYYTNVEIMHETLSELIADSPGSIDVALSLSDAADTLKNHGEKLIADLDHLASK